MENKPFISVLLPVYNCEKYIFEAIQSILNQTYTHFELLIIDDCSTDTTLQLCRSFQDDRIVIIEKENNSGLINSLNFGVSIAKGKYIARMDGDDISLPERFEKQIAFLEDNPKVILCGTAIQLIDKGTVYKQPLNHEEIKISLCFGTSFYHPTVMGIKEVFQTNLYDKNFEHAEDYELWTRLAFIGQLANLEEVFLHYRIHENQVSEQKKDIQSEKSLLIKQKLLTRLVAIEITNSLEFRFFLNDISIKSIQDCKKLLEITRKLIIENNNKKSFNKFLFKKKLLENRDNLLKNYINKKIFFKVGTIVFLLKYITFKDIFKIFILKKG